MNETTALTVRYTPSEVDSGDFLTAGVQDTYVDANLSFEDDGSGNYVDEISITLDNDNNAEVTGEIEVSINSDPAAPNLTYRVGSTSTAKTRILDNEAPELSITGGPKVTEGTNVQAIFTITSLVQPSGNSIDIDYTPVSANFLAVGTSGDKVTNHTLNFTGAGPYTASLPITVHNDEIKEENGSISVTLNQKDPIAGYTVVSAPRNEASVSVQDDDSLPRLEITASEAAFAENLANGASLQ